MGSRLFTKAKFPRKIKLKIAHNSTLHHTVYPSQETGNSFLPVKSKVSPCTSHFLYYLYSYFIIVVRDVISKLRCSNTLLSGIWIGICWILDSLSFSVFWICDTKTFWIPITEWVRIFSGPTHPSTHTHFPPTLCFVSALFYTPNPFIKSLYFYFVTQVIVIFDYGDFLSFSVRYVTVTYLPNTKAARNLDQNGPWKMVIKVHFVFFLVIEDWFY